MPTPWFSVATYFKGQTEVHGSADNPVIVEMFRVSGNPGVHDDETPWCAAFVGTCLRLAGYRSTGSLGARSYANFGQDLKKSPVRGCVVVFWRGDPKAATGHVAFFDHEDAENVYVLGGNQSDAVNVSRYPKSRVLAYRMPVETTSLPTDTRLPNILTIDPGNAPAHVRAAAASVPADPTMPREIRATDVLADGAVGARVEALQRALTGRGFQLGAVDGEFGPMTAAALSGFQAFQGLPVTGSADPATLRALGLPPTESARFWPETAPVPQPASWPTFPAPQLPSVPGLGGGQAMQSQEILKLLFEALAARHGPAMTEAQPRPAVQDGTQLLQTVLGALAGKAGAPPGGTAPPATAPVPSLSPIDKLLGGEALAGKKTPLAILAYIVLAILQSRGEVGNFSGEGATATGQVLTTLVASFGGMGVLAKVDRVVQLLGVIASKRPRA